MVDLSNISYFLRKCSKYECSDFPKDWSSPFKCDDLLDDGSSEELGSGKLKKMSALSTIVVFTQKKVNNLKEKL